jgi:hypothetical protein
MKLLIDHRELNSIPLVERTILLEREQSKVTLVFTLVGDLSFYIEFMKVYKDYTLALNSVIDFRDNNTDNPGTQWEDECSFDNCIVPDDCIDPRRFPLFMARDVMNELIERFHRRLES